MLDVLGLGTTAENIYLAMIANPEWGVARLAEALRIHEDQVRLALDELFELDLLSESVEQNGALRPVSPGLGLQRLLARQSAEVERRRQRIAEGAAEIATLVTEYAEQRRPGPEPQVRRLSGLDAAYARLEELAGSTGLRIHSLLPADGGTPGAVEAELRNTARLLANGGSARIVIPEAARAHRPTLAHARAILAAGGEVRTAATVPIRALVVDGWLALIPVDPQDSHRGVLQLDGPGPAAALAALFALVWAGANPLETAERRDARGLTAVERELLVLLGHGHTDESAASRLGVSQRTCRRMMAEMMRRLGARSRFEAGALAARAGWL